MGALRQMAGRACHRRWCSHAGMHLGECARAGQLCGHLVAAEHHVFALIVSLYVFSLKVIQVLLMFRKPSYIMPYYPEHQPRILDIPVAAFVLATALGCVHYSLSLLDVRAYSRQPTAVDGFYFSIITFSTVGYGLLS
jgi:Ion channel